jgi:pantoate--beta-alanine ligase|tara:strand:- start:267 stop:1100 length:834 start_codon:yes stop_codon:yes gene_type:complete
MKIINKISELQYELNKNKNSLGLVPTMGKLHNGHRALIHKAREDNDFLAVSLFVNPSQFGSNEDFSKYPKDIKIDLEILKSDNVDLVFTPDIEEIYPHNFSTKVVIEGLTQIYEGKYRPGHFDGVSTIVTKLFALFKPNKAYFGAKDAQQCAVVKRLNKDLNLGVEVFICPTIRDKDGLALSSRNSYLNIKQRYAAVLISEGLFKALELFQLGENNVSLLCRKTRSVIESNSLLEIDYIDIVNRDTFQKYINVGSNSIMIVAVRIGDIRLIDNIEIR